MLVIELGVNNFIFGKNVEKVQAFSCDKITNDLDNFVMLQHFTRDIEGRIFAINNAFYKVQI